jgi:hypothetical protein
VIRSRFIHSLLSYPRRGQFLVTLRGQFSMARDSAHWAHPHTASFFIPRVIAQASADHGWRIFYAYSDPEAGEIGTVYQATNWLYIGQGVGRAHRPRWQYRRRDWPKGKWIDERSFYRRGHTIADVKNGAWTRRGAFPKHKYVQFVGDNCECRKLRKALRYPVLRHPKRTNIRKTKIHQVKDGRGRPATGLDPSVTIRLSAKLLAWIDRKGKSRTAVIRRLLEAARAE